MVRQRRQKFRTLLIVLFVSVEQRRGAPDFYFLVATSCCKSTSIRVRVDGINRSRTVVRDEGWFVYQHHFCRSHESLPRATPAAPSRERARAGLCRYASRVIYLNILKSKQILFPSFLKFPVACVFVVCFASSSFVFIQMPTAGEIYFSRETR